MPELDIGVDGRVARVRLNRPHSLNALTPTVLETLVEGCQRLRSDDAIDIAVFEGVGPCFSAGADLPAFRSALEASSAPSRAVADLGRRAAEAIAELPQVTLAAVHGHCVGGGVVLAASCDLRWASEDARFSIPETLAGIPLAWGGLARLVDLVGETAAVDLVLTGRRFGPEEARRLGIVTRVVERGEWTQAVESTVADLEALPSLVLRTTKQQLQAIRRGHFDAKLDADALLAAMADPACQAQATRYWEKKGGR